MGAGREGYLATLASVAKSLRGAPFSFLWSEGGAQERLEEARGITFGYPALAVLSVEKSVYAVQKLSWSEKNVKAFLNGVMSGSERTAAIASMPNIAKVEPWDGKDAQVAFEEYPLDD